LKIIANATSYGIFVELIVEELDFASDETALRNRVLQGGGSMSAPQRQAAKSINAVEFKGVGEAIHRAKSVRQRPSAANRYCIGRGDLRLSTPHKR
jgi:hypothetical protein